MKVVKNVAERRSYDVSMIDYLDFCTTYYDVVIPDTDIDDFVDYSLFDYMDEYIEWSGLLSGEYEVVEPEMDMMKPSYHFHTKSILEFNEYNHPDVSGYFVSEFIQHIRCMKLKRINESR